ncbi:MAG: tripartite tricarboxylate transporter TctB family protein [Lautropia sp.]
MNRGSFIFALALECVGLFVLVYSYRLGLQTITRPGPGLFPFLLGILLCLVAVPALVQSSRGAAGSHRADGSHPADGTQETRPANALASLGLVIACLFGFYFLLEVLGFFITTFLFLFGLFWVGNPGRWVFIALLSAVTVAATYLMFDTLLQVALPWGFLK